MEQQFTPQQRLERAHVKLMEVKELRFFGAISLYGENDIGTDRTETAATDGINTYYNPDFCQELDNKELLFIVLHEQMHKAYKHVFVWKHLVKEDPLLANMAMDYVINLQLADLAKATGEKYFKMPTFKEGPKKGEPMALVDEAYRDKNTVQVFNILKQKNNPPPPIPRPPKGGSGDGNDGNDHDPKDIPPVNNPSNNSKEEKQYSDEIEELKEKMFDDHNWDSEKEKSAEELQEMAEELDRAVRQAAQVAGDAAGVFAATIRELIEVKTPWEEVLAEFIQNTCKGEDISTFRRFNRRLLGSGIYAPSSEGEAIGSIVIGVDTSGSICQEDIDRFLSEVKVIVEDVVPEKVHLLYWGTDVVAHEIYTEDDYNTLTDTTKPKGGGGTDPHCVVEYVENNILLDSDVECMLLLTDAYVGGLSEAVWDSLEYPLLWAVCPDGYKEFNPKVGQVLHLD